MEQTLSSLTKPYKKATTLQISQGFRDSHKAIDIVDKYGTPICAPENVKITRIFSGGKLNDDTWGLTQGYGVHLLGMETGNSYVYWHFLPYMPYWSGDYVSRGKIIGFMGNSGEVYTGGVYVPISERPVAPYRGTHLHLSVWNNKGIPVDPIPLIDWFTEPSYSTAELLVAWSLTLKKITQLAFR